MLQRMHLILHLHHQLAKEIDMRITQGAFSFLPDLTDQQIHVTKAAATENGAAKMYGNGIIKGYTAMKQTDQMNLAQYWNKTLDANSTIFSNFESGEYGDVPKQAKDVQRVLNAQAKASLSPAEYAEWKKHNIDLWKGHEEFGALVNYSTTNTYMPDFETQEDFEVGEMASWGVAGAGAAGAGMLVFGAANAWNPLGWGVLGALGFASLIGMGANAVSQTVEKGYLSEKSRCYYGEMLAKYHVRIVLWSSGI